MANNTGDTVTILSTQALLAAWVCTRWMDPADSWMGAMIVAAHNPKEARHIFSEAQGRDPEKVDILLGVYAIGESRILYDDEIC